MKYVMCIERGEYRVSLTLHKVYKVLPDPVADRHNQIRIIDDSEEDYLFPVQWFVPVELPPEGQAALDKAPA